MFRKPFHVKSNTNMRGSDRRHLKGRLSECFPVLTPEVMADILPNKMTVNVMKLTTHSGEDILVYLLESQPLFFECNERLYPTVYILWSLPDLVPSLSTWPPVFEKLAKGADLMLPGVVVPDTGLPEFVRNRPCAVNLEGNAAAMAVGSTSMASGDMTSCGMKGKGVLVKHCFGDHLWEAGDKSTPPHIPPGDLKSQESTESPEASLTDNLAEKEESGELKLDSLSLENRVATQEEALENAEQLAKDAENGEEEEGESLSPVEQMDALFYQCLLHSLKTKVKASDLPMTTIILYRTHMRSVCPPSMNLDVKKSSYKKLNKFLGYAESKGLIEVKETSRGVDSLVNFDRRHNDLLEFQIPENVFSEDVKEERKFHIPQEASNDTKGSWQGTLHQMYSVTSAMARVLEPMGYRKGSWMKAEEVRSAVTEYVKRNELVDPLNRSQVILDPHLHDAIMDKSEGYITHLPWDQVFTRCFAKMSSGYQMLPSEQASNRPVIKGKLKPISLKIERKAGNKLMTVIQNLDPYGIDIKDFAHRLQIGVAASATISQGHGQKSGQEVRVQGNQINYLSKLLLEEYEIPRRFVQGLDLAPKSKKR
ncbi:eukaryotic translation initiation factor 2D-like [Apostichopus japonicus]|uniref:eukaryotic translation initiation factor 2D-like n=1 Tax=Stichopus japonicus TaxID=307972 RepID=UPI003AB8C679